ncbi:MAG: endonuclease/exonuclease/phosphatase family protein [Paracoccaceae bacterium]
MIRWLTLALGVMCFGGLANASDTVRVATYNAELFRDGPGLLLRDILKGKDAQVQAVVRVLQQTQPDILAVQGIDWDYDGLALTAFADALRQAGVDYPHQFAARPNSGVASGFDLDGDGRLGEPEDSLGFGEFTGQAGLAVLSRYPIAIEDVQDFTGLLWRDLPGHSMPVLSNSDPFPSAEVQAMLPLSVSALWAVPVQLPDDTTLTLLTFRASPPVFDGPEDMNGLRNLDETRFWPLYLDGQFGPAPPDHFVLAGQINMDPHDSDGRADALHALLADPRFQDPKPVSSGAATARDQGHISDNALDTVDWPGPGRLRVDYVLPSADWQVVNSGVHWPTPDQPGYDDVVEASRHRLVWVDLAAKPAP